MSAVARELRRPPEAAEEQFGKVMRIPDDLLDQWYRLVMHADNAPDGDPLAAKLALARFVVARAHGEDAADVAEAHFTRVVREGRAPDDVPEAPLPSEDPVHLPSLLVAALGIGTTSEARRLIEQRAVKLNDEVVTELDVPRERLAGALVQAGKRRFVRFPAA